ncbi:MAG: DNA polymerase III subunit delta' [bacterium]
MDDVQTHNTIRKLLARALREEKICHAYLVAGPEGCGKRTMARELATALVCERRTFPPCGRCGPCRRVSAGNHPDVTQVEPETRNILIRQIRELAGRLHYHSFEGGYKAGIIPDCEMMTEKAQNAFLKTLEEPPADTVLILTTTNLSKVVPTIQSRCQIVRLGPLPTSLIKELVEKQRGLSPEDAELVACLAQGNARRALDMDLSLVVDSRKELLKKLISIEPDDRVGMLNFAESLAKDDLPQDFLLDLLAGFYLDVLYVKLGKTNIRNRDLLEEAGRQARKTPLQTIISRVEYAQRARDRIYLYNSNPRLTWEVLTMSLLGLEGAKVNAL